MCGRWRTSTLPLPSASLCIVSSRPWLCNVVPSVASEKRSCRGSTLRDCDTVALGIRVSLQSPLATLSCSQMRRAALVWLTRGCQVRLPLLTSTALESMEHSPLPEEMMRKPSRWYPRVGLREAHNVSHDPSNQASFPAWTLCKSAHLWDSSLSTQGPTVFPPSSMPVLRPVVLKRWSQTSSITASPGTC